MLSRKARSLTPYVAGEQLTGGYIKLNTNENPYPPSPKAAEALRNFDAAKLRLYPDPNAKELAAAIASVEGVAPENIFLGNGSDEILAFAFAALFDDSVCFADVTYSFYPVYCDFYGLKKNIVPLNADYTYDLARYKNEKGGIVFANPNAPTSLGHSSDEILSLAKTVSCNVLVDEAYIDFSLRAKSLAKAAVREENLLVVKTFSKSYSLAGLRCGYAVGNSNLIGGLTRIKDSFNSYPLDAVCQAAARAAVLDREYFSKKCAAVIKTRESAVAALRAAGHIVFQSDTNFLFIKHRKSDGADAYQKLKERGILTRHFASPRVKDFVRVTIGTDTDTARFIKIFNEL